MSWNEDKLPTSGWEFQDVADLGEPIGSCDFCGTIIRYEHTLTHILGHEVGVGCICADRLTQEVGAGKAREKEFRKLASKRDRSRSRFPTYFVENERGNYYAKKLGITIFHRNGEWTYVSNGCFSDRKFCTLDTAMAALRDTLFP